MSKRIAEYQLTDRSREADDAEETPSEGYTKASAEVLAGRKIKGLPARGSKAPAATPKSSPFEAPTSTSPFVAPSKPSSFAFTIPNTTTASTTASASTPIESTTPSFTYLSSLRSLNHSFVARLTNDIETDPFVDLTARVELLITKYTNKLTELKNSLENVAKEALKPEVPKPANIQQKEVKPLFSASFTTNGFKGMPVVPAGGFNTFAGNTLTPLPFAPVSTKDTSKPEKKEEQNEVKNGMPFVPSIGFNTFAGNPLPDTPLDTSKDTKVQEKDTNKETPKTPPKATTPLGFSFGSGQKSPSFGFGAALKTSPAAAKSETAGFSFGAPVSFGSSGFSATPTPAFGSSTPVAPAFGLGASVFGGGVFGSGGSSFGATSVTNNTFGSTASAETPKEESTKESAPAPETTETESSSLVKPVRGEGEESETTLHSIRGKIFKSSTSETGGLEFKEMGIALIEIKKHTETEKIRLLGRNDGGKVVVNFLLNDSFEPSIQPVGKNGLLTFRGFDGVDPIIYRLRVKTMGDGEEFLTKSKEVAKGLAK